MRSFNPLRLPEVLVSDEDGKPESQDLVQVHTGGEALGLIKTDWKPAIEATPWWRDMKLLAWLSPVTGSSLPHELLLIVRAGLQEVVVMVPATGDSSREKNLGLTLAVLGLLAGPTVERWRGCFQVLLPSRWCPSRPPHRPDLRLSEEQTFSTGRTQGAQ